MMQKSHNIEQVGETPAATKKYRQMLWRDAPSTQERKDSHNCCGLCKFQATHKNQQNKTKHGQITCRNKLPRARIHYIMIVFTCYKIQEQGTVKEEQTLLKNGNCTNRMKQPLKQKENSYKLNSG